MYSFKFTFRKSLNTICNFSDFIFSSISFNLVSISKHITSHSFVINCFVSLLFKNNKTNYITCFDEGTLKCYNGLLREKIIPCSKLLFENKKYLVPSDYDYRLTCQYNDYMIIPPVEKQINHSPVKLVFEDGETIENK